MQKSIDKLTAAQRTKELTPDQHIRVDRMLVELVCAISKVTNLERLGAR